jgi:hypothetical protein
MGMTMDIMEANVRRLPYHAPAERPVAEARQAELDAFGREVRDHG